VVDLPFPDLPFPDLPFPDLSFPDLMRDKFADPESAKPRFILYV
jgi:hypothetical protein